ncbi:MAG: hypothetical protein AB7F59_13275 [Bdellovibrionales bacterium]
MKNIFLAMIALAMISCSGLTHFKDEAAVGEIKKVAVVAFMVQQPSSASLGVDLSKGQLKAGNTANFMPTEGTHADLMYTDLSEALKKNLRWNVMDKKTMASNAGYVKAYKQTMDGWQNKMPPGEGMNQFLVAQVMDAEGPRILDMKGRDELIEALKVDAIMVARVNVILNGTSIMGLGSRYPQSKVSFFVYKKGVEKHIWFDGGIDGEESKTSVGGSAFIDETLLSNIAVASAKTAFAKIGPELRK